MPIFCYIEMFLFRNIVMSKSRSIEILLSLDQMPNEIVVLVKHGMPRLGKFARQKPFELFNLFAIAVFHLGRVNSHGVHERDPMRRRAVVVAQHIGRGNHRHLFRIDAKFFPHFTADSRFDILAKLNCPAAAVPSPLLVAAFGAPLVEKQPSVTVVAKKYAANTNVVHPVRQWSIGISY